MGHILFSSFLLLATAVVAGPGALAASESDDAWLILRVGGDLDIRTEFKVNQYVSGKSVVESSLPDGYPAPTPPGAIDLKRYPSVRRAEVSGDRNPDGSRNGAFWSLFQHIESRDIAMTSPVEMDYQESPTDGAWTMSFLYRTPDVGTTGSDGRVRVVDTEPVTVVSIGLRGRYGAELVDRGLSDLAQWLSSQAEWEQAGEARSLYYNGPYIPNDRKWAEVQIPVRRVASSTIVQMETVEESVAKSPMELIELAVERGAPLFNDHQPAACSAIYEVTIEWLLAMGPELDGEIKAMLRTSLDEMRGHDDPIEQAWVLRRALDTVYEKLVRTAVASGR